MRYYNYVIRLYAWCSLKNNEQIQFHYESKVKMKKYSLSNPSHINFLLMSIVLQATKSTALRFEFLFYLRKRTLTIYKAFPSFMDKSVQWSKSMLSLSSSEMLSGASLIYFSSGSSTDTKNLLLFFNNNLHYVRFYSLPFFVSCRIQRFNTGTR